MQWNLIKQRKKKRETQADLADIINVDTSTYRNKEMGKTQFKGDEMFLLSAHYNVPIDNLFLPSNDTKRVKRGVN